MIGGTTFLGQYVATFGGATPVRLSRDHSHALAANSAGTVGWARSAQGTRATLRFQGGQLDIDTPASFFAQTYDIDDADLVVGARQVVVPRGIPPLREFVRDLTTGADTELAPLAGVRTSVASAVNDDGLVAGQSDNDMPGPRHAVVGSGGEVLDLNLRLDPASPGLPSAPGLRVLLTRAADVNSPGQSTCSGLLVDDAGGTQEERAHPLRPTTGGLVVTPRTVDFGRTVVGDAGRRTVTDRNARDRKAAVTVGRPAKPFAAGTRRLTLNPGQEQARTVAAKPTDAGVVAGSLDVSGGKARAVKVRLAATAVDAGSAVVVEPPRATSARSSGTRPGPSR